MVGDDEMQAEEEEQVAEDEDAVKEEEVDFAMEEDAADEEVKEEEAADEEVKEEEEAVNGDADDEELVKDEHDDDGHLADDGVEVQEHLKDAVEGSLRLKRYLTQDEDNGSPVAKKIKVGDEETEKKVKQLMLKWRTACPVVKHVLVTLPTDELDVLIKSNYVLDIYNQWRTPCELLAKTCAELRERKLPPRDSLDCVSAFRHRWKLDAAKEASLRKLSHKDLRYVLDNYDDTQPWDEIMADAASAEPGDEETAANALPDGKGALTLSRFSRLELIDPLADCAVFGDANLTFSLRLAKHRKAMGHVGRVIATTFEELDTLRERYKEIDQSIQTLEDHYAEVYHGVDCTRIAIDSRFEALEGTLGAVYYNFPHSGAIQGFFDGHPIVNWRHENLMRLFFRALRSFVKPGGVVKVSSNSSAIGVRYSYIIGSALENEFIHTETMSFLEWHLHRYGRSYGDRRDAYKRPDAEKNQSYNAQNAEKDMVYCFKYAPSGETLGKQQIRLPPTLKTLQGCNDGPFKNLPEKARQNLAKQLHQRFVTEVSGTHVG